MRSAERGDAVLIRDASPRQADLRSASLKSKRRSWDSSPLSKALRDCLLIRFAEVAALSSLAPKTYPSRKPTLVQSSFPLDKLHKHELYSYTFKIVKSILLFYLGGVKQSFTYLATRLRP